MKTCRPISINRFALLWILILGGLPRPRPALAQTDLLANGGFESFDGTGLATSWTRWAEEIPNPGDGSFNYAARPEWSPESNPVFVQGGGQSQHIGANWNPWHAGIFQTITAAPGAQIRITAYGRVFASTPDFPNPSDTLVQARMQIGADPNGGAEWWSGSVQWSGAGNPHDTWQPFTLDVSAGESGRVTIFLSANYRGDSRYHLDSWWDSVSAVVTGAEPTSTATSAPLPTAAAPTTDAACCVSTTPAAAATPPAPTALPPAAATGVPIQTTGPGSACVTVYEDANGDGKLEGGEPLIAGGQIEIADALTTVARYTTDGVSEPWCFDNLGAGPYEISATLPSGYFPTTGNRFAITLAPGARADVQFGAQSSRIGPAQAATPAGGSAPEAEPDLTVWLAAGGVAALLLLAIAAALFVVLRRRS